VRPIHGGFGGTHALQSGVPLISSANHAPTFQITKSRALVASVLAGLATTLSPGRADADVKKVCAAAADAGQTARDEGHYRAAREAFLTCAREACPKLVAQTCSGWLHELDAATPTIVLGAKDEKGLELTDVHVEIDGAPFADHLDGKPVPLEPGDHTVHFERGGITAVEHVVARTGEKNRRVSVALVAPATPSALRRTEDAAPETADPTSPPPATPSSSESPSPARIAAGSTLLALAFGAGVTGAYMFVQSSHAADEAAVIRAGIPPYACAQSSNATCTTLSQDVDMQRRDATIGGLVLAGAGAFALASIATWVFWPTRTESAAWIAPSFVPRGASLTVAGAF